MSSASPVLPFRGLILDFVGVLTAPVGPPLRRWCVDQGLPAHAWGHVLGRHPEGRRLYRELEAGRLGQAEWNRLTALLLGVDEHVDLMGRAWARVQPAVEMVELARLARRAGVRTALLSNSFGRDPYDPYRVLGVAGLCEVEVLSEVEGLAKPDPEIYRRTLDRMGLDGGECVFVDDRAENLSPAAELGITVVHADSSPGTAGRVAGLLGLPGG
ncbi:HAD-IA family hydrolase [Nocardiopsis changdeensis]|uniref:HAD-IA family hydrolase n=1 Tax=Nocardiopsis changdeensis TaxID=2831969 RepID=A0ABX8BEB2_9ACTN|nr:MULTISPECIES: HAD-IA family hydrolase [Nocardiopsis]QUX20585.1 HAD-IA family hydrolase [Nocardiopsis changdeensis]QYX36516.1 HAD-IA family hydrolase [Nocardiopsis sp. MT53]